MKTKKYPDRRPAGAYQKINFSKEDILYFSKKISPRQRILLEILLKNPDGVLSNRLREKIKTNNVHNYVKQLRETGLKIPCKMVDFEGDFGPGKIGLFRLADESRSLAAKLLEVR